MAEPPVKPIYSVQGHLIYSITPGIWLGFNALYYTGGRGIIDGNKGQSLEDARIGLTLATDQPVQLGEALRQH